MVRSKVFRCFIGFSHRWKALPDLSSLHIQSIILDNYGIISKASPTANEAARWANVAYAINRSSGNSAPCSTTSLPTRSTSNEGLPPAIKRKRSSARRLKSCEQIDIRQIFSLK